MPGKKLEDDSKVMDVSKPGKGKIVTTSRPVVAPIASVETAKSAPVPTGDSPVKEVVMPKAPSAGHKVIQPLNEIKVEDTVPEEPPAPAPPADEVPPASEAAPPPPETAVKPEETHPTTPAAAANKPQADPAPAPVAHSSSEGAEVNALAEQATAKREAAKKAEEQAKRDAALQELIASKKYFVKTSHGSAGAQRSRTWRVVFFMLFLAVVVAGYVAADAGILDIGLTLPYDFIKQ